MYMIYEKDKVNFLLFKGTTYMLTGWVESDSDFIFFLFCFIFIFRQRLTLM